MSGGNAQKTLLLRVNLTLIERVVHATRTVLREYRVELTPFREGQLVSAIYEEMVAQGGMELSYEEILRHVDEKFRVSKWRAEARAAEEWPGARSEWMGDGTETLESAEPNKVWKWLEAHRRGSAWLLAVAAVMMAGLVARMIINRWF